MREAAILTGCAAVITAGAGLTLGIGAAIFAGLTFVAGFAAAGFMALEDDLKRIDRKD